MSSLHKTINSKKSYAVKLFTCVAFFCLSSSLFSTGFAQDQDLAKKHAPDLRKIESYLNNLKYLSAKFTQKTHDGQVMEGKFLLSRPGKMRVEYVQDPKILIIVNGSVLAYRDVELEETSYIRTNTTPASFLTRKNISFLAKDIEITNVEKTKDHIKVSVVKKNRKEAGEFSLVFTNNPFQFVRMEVKNDLEQVVIVTLRDLDFSKKLSRSLFIVKNKNLPQ